MMNKILSYWEAADKGSDRSVGYNTIAAVPKGEGLVKNHCRRNPGSYLLVLSGATSWKQTTDQEKRNEEVDGNTCFAILRQLR